MRLEVRQSGSSSSAEGNTEGTTTHHFHIALVTLGCVYSYCIYENNLILFQNINNYYKMSIYVRLDPRLHNEENPCVSAHKMECIHTNMNQPVFLLP